MSHSIPRLCIVIPCFNEEEVLPLTAPLFLEELKKLIEENKIQKNSRILFVDDGSRDRTWEIISRLSSENEWMEGIQQSRNRGHQNAIMAGMMEAKDCFDCCITVDCDGQDDPHAMEDMVDAYLDDCEIVYGVRRSRRTDSNFKRGSALSYYRFLKLLGVESITNHADYRLLSARVLQELSKYEEVNLYLRGLIPLVGFKSTCVYYDRSERMAGKTHYSLRKMVGLGWDGITSLSIKPIRIVMVSGIIISLLSFIAIIWAIITQITGHAITGWASTVCIVCFIGGIQLICTGIIGEYIGKIYLEVKKRPRYIISERTNKMD